MYTCTYYRNENVSRFYNSLSSFLTIIRCEERFKLFYFSFSRKVKVFCMFLLFYYYYKFMF